MIGHAHIAARDGVFAVKASVKVRYDDGTIARAMSVLYFPTFDAACAYAIACDYVVSHSVRPEDLRPSWPHRRLWHGGSA